MRVRQPHHAAEHHGRELARPDELHVRAPVVSEVLSCVLCVSLSHAPSGHRLLAPHSISGLYLPAAKCYSKFKGSFTTPGCGTNGCIYGCLQCADSSIIGLAADSCALGGEFASDLLQISGRALARGSTEYPAFFPQFTFCQARQRARESVVDARVRSRAHTHAQAPSYQQTPTPPPAPPARLPPGTTLASVCTIGGSNAGSVFGALGTILAPFSVSGVYQAPAVCDALAAATPAHNVCGNSCRRGCLSCASLVGGGAAWDIGRSVCDACRSQALTATLSGCTTQRAT